jgi:low affinity Fe/Cu permease
VAKLPERCSLSLEALLASLWPPWPAWPPLWPASDARSRSLAKFPELCCPPTCPALADRFSRAAQWTSQQCGRAYTFVAAVVVIVVWAISGPAFHFSDTWQLVINTGTTIIIFLMVFLIQNTQTRDTTAIQLKLDELIRANTNARDQLLRLEDLTENQIKDLKESFSAIGSVAAIREPLEAARQDLAEVAETTGKGDLPRSSCGRRTLSHPMTTALFGLM